MSSTQTIAVSVSNVNDVAAVIDLDGNNSSGASGFNYQTSFTEGGAPVRIADVDVQISDADSALITAARVQISNVEAGDFLTVGTLPAGIVASAYNPTTGLLTLSGSASLAAYQSAIRAVQFTNDGSASGAAKDIQVSVNDGSAWSNVAHTSVTMVLVPTVSISDMSVQEPQSGTTTLTFTINIDTPPASNLTFTYQTVNGSAQGGSDYQQVGPLTGTILAGQTSTTVSITINSDANVYEGDENFYLNVTGFNQTVNYAPGSHLITNGVQAVGTIGANNGAPVAEDDLYLTGQDEVLVTGNVLANDTLVDGAVVSTFDSLSSAGGSVSYNGDGTFTYTPANGFVGTDTFTYTLIDDDGEIDTATVTVEVSDVTISPPTIGALADVTYVENAVGTALFDGLTITDADSNNLSSVVVTINGFINAQDVIDYLTAGTNVTAVVNQTGTTWQLTLSGGADIGEYITVLDTLTYQNSSENPSVSIRNVSLTAYDQNFANIFDSEAFQLQVTPVNDAPQVFDNSKFVVEGTLSTPLNIQAPTDVDSDDSQLLITVLTLPDITTGIVMMADGLTQVTVGQVLTLGQLTSLVFDASGAEASDTFTYSVFDGELTTIGTTALNVGATQPDFNTVYESGLPSGSGVEGQSAQASGNLFDNDGSGGGTLTSIQFNSTTYSPVGGVITVTTPLGVLTVDANTGDYTYQLSTSNSTGTDVNEVFTYNFVNVTPLSDNLTITIVDDIPIASNVAQTIPESEENIFNLMFSLDISTSMNAAVGSSGDTRLSLAKESLVSLAEEYFNQSTQVSLTLLLFANGAHRVGTFTDFESAKAAIQAVTDVNQTSYSNHLGTGSLTNQTSYVDALSMIRNEFTADLAGQNSADNIQNISYFLSDGAVTADGSPVNMGYREFVNANGIKSYSVGIGDGLPTNLTDLNYAHNIDAYGRGHGTIDNALIVSDVSLLKSELLSTVPTAFGGNITQEGTITRVAMGADGGHVASIEILLGDPAVAHTISYDGVNFSVSPALPVSLEIDGTKVILDANDGFQYGTFTMDFADGSYLFIAPNGNAGSEFSFNYTVVDGDNDSASATARFYIVDDKPDARDDLHVGDYYQPLEGNVISGVGTDGGPALGSGFTPFAIQGGGVDKVVDNADVSNVKYKGIEFDLDFTTAPAAGSSGTLSWSYSTETDINGTLIREIVVTDSSDLSTLVFRSNGYYNFARDGGVDHSVNTTSLTNVNNSGFSLAGFSASGASSAITYQSTGIGVQGGGWNDRINQGERVDINFMSKGLNPFGVHDITFTLTSYDRAAESVTLVIYGVDGVTVLGTENVTGATLTISRLDYPQIGKVSFIADTADTYVRISNITYTTLSSDALLAANAPVLIDYTLTDSDGQSDIAQLALYTINNTITGTAGNDNIIGGALNDAITGAAGDDILSGGAGNDSISGGAGKDIISGGTGNDYLSGGADNDELYGNDGDDHLAGDAGNDLLDGGIGADILLGGAGDDQLFGGADNDRLYGGDGNDKLYGGSGDDLLVGEAGDDLLNGGTGNDILYGGLDQDTLIGGEGDDILFGGRGDDTLTGGNGSDRFMWVAGNAGTDTVTDFNVGEGDVLDLSDLLIGEESGDLLDYLQFSVVDGNTYISVDANAGASFETGQVIILQGLDLTAAGTLTNQQIIDDLLTGGNLYVDS
ncbi:Ig-like domain-containing protein [Simiduia litorea]